MKAIGNYFIPLIARVKILSIGLFFCFFLKACSPAKIQNEKKTMNAKDLLGNAEYPAMCYGGYRQNTRDIQPTIAEIKEDLKILSAFGVKLLRNYNVHYEEAENLLYAIRELKKEDPQFEMYLMLGVWIDCKDARTAHPNHQEESELNQAEVERAVKLVKKFPEIIKIVAVGNEAMVKWATSYYVEPGIILKWVNHFQNLKSAGELPTDLWITSSDNFASWGGGGQEYHVPELEQLIKAVDFISMHTYPMHDTHYNPDFWVVPDEESKSSDLEKINAAMLRARLYAMEQYNSVLAYLDKLGLNKPVHIGETGWSSFGDDYYGNEGSHATDEYKSGLYYQLIREWTREAGLTCFYFEAFDEPWKDAANPNGSENHFGLMNGNAQAKYALWDEVDLGVFAGLTRGGKAITKTFNGNLEALMKEVKCPKEAFQMNH
jgi:exo-beta-1,3-glucanase (GH17 family)